MKNLTPVMGWETEREQGLLASLYAQVPAGGNIVEIGSEYGMSASLAVIYSDNLCNLFCIEINPDAPFLENLKDAGILTNWITPVIGDSKSVPIPQKVFDDGIDVLFVDGDHSYDGALADLKRWSEYMNHHGLIAVHDCACATNKEPHPDHFAVHTAVQHFLSSEVGLHFRYMYSVDSTMVLMRVS